MGEGRVRGITFNFTLPQPLPSREGKIEDFNRVKIGGLLQRLLIASRGGIW
jgi:hypothetical protein